MSNTPTLDAAQIKERPILMHARSIRGILEGRKTQTRRIIKPQPVFSEPKSSALVNEAWQAGFVDVKCPYGKPGSQLWVRETFYVDTVPIGRLLPSMANTSRNDIYFRADGECCKQIPECSCAEVGKPRWRPGIHMPRWVCRLTLKITDVRVERVQDISDHDCEAEGVRPSVDGTGKDWRENETGWRRTFRQLWDDTNGKHSWESNPWVWVIEFRKL